MDTGTVNDISQSIAYFYRDYLYMSNRRWRMRGLKFTDLKNGTLDLKAMENAFEECKNDPMPSRLVAYYLIRIQVQAIKHLAFGESAVGSLMFRGVNSQEIYDRLTFKCLSFHKRVLEQDGSFKKTFLVNPASCIYNMTVRCIKDVMYDLSRFEIESSKGKKGAKVRPMDKRSILARRSQYCNTRDLESWMDTIGRDPFEGQDRGVVPCQ